MSAKHYVNNADFLVALVDYQDKCAQAKALSQEDPPIPDYVGECFLKISEHLSRKPNFNGYSFREEMVGDGIENCLQYFRNFDPTKTKNPFSYFTQIVFYAFLRRIHREKKQLYVKYKATQQFGLLNEGESYEDAHGNMQQFQLYDNIAEFIETYEKTKNAKKKVQIKGLELFLYDDMEELTKDDEE